MSISSDQPANIPPDPGQTVVVDIDRYLANGLAVFDANGDRVGEVWHYSTAAGYLMVLQMAPQEHYLYLPFRIIRSIDPKAIYVAEAKSNLPAHYAQPPTITTVSEMRPVSGRNGTTLERHDIQMVQSGYD